MKPSGDIFVAQKDASQQQKVTKLIGEIKKPLLIITSFFPFDLFPDQLVITPLEVSYIYNMFFLISYQRSILISDIGDIIMTQGPIFATLTILPLAQLKSEPIIIRTLRQKDAKKAHNVLQGLITLYKEKIDVNEILANPQSLSEIEKVGEVREEKK